jgi:hypothetical protein
MYARKNLTDMMSTRFREAIGYVGSRSLSSSVFFLKGGRKTFYSSFERKENERKNVVETI